MRYGFAVLAILTVVYGLQAPNNRTVVGGEPPKSESPPATEEPLLLLDDEPLLLLTEDSDSDASAEQGVDNSRCHVCHLNFSMEKIAVTHAKKGISCSDCHGDCDAHIDDESWASGGPGTPPEIMFPRERIDPACMKCHEQHTATPRLMIKRWQDRKLGDKPVAEVVCTDCHGKHKVNPSLRNAWWDKKTGKPTKP